MPMTMLNDDALADGATARAATDATERTTIRVMHLVNGEHYAGAERVQDLLALRLPEYGVEPAIACLKPDRFPAARSSQATPLYQLPMRGRFDFRPAWKLARLLRRGRFSLLHTHTPRAALIGRIAAVLAGVPIVHHVHGQTATEVRGQWWTRAMAHIERTCVARAAAVIAVSQTAGEYLIEQGLDADRLRVVPNGVPSRDLNLHRWQHRRMDVRTDWVVAAAERTRNGARSIGPVALAAFAGPAARGGLV